MEEEEEEREERGWGKGEFMFADWKPWVAVLLDSKRTSYCEGCFHPHRPSMAYIECEDCGLVSYCSWRCRARDEFHGLECDIFSREGRVPHRDEVRVMVRAVRKLLRTGGRLESLCEGGGEGDRLPGRTKMRTFKDLMSWKEAFLKSEQRKEDIQIVFDETEEFLGEETPTFDQFMEVLGRLYINGFEICDKDMNTYGWGVYLGPSILDHSCQPNSTVSFSGCLLSVQTVVAIPRLEDAFISYLDPSLPGPVRRSKMETNYFFTCECVKCKHSHSREKNQARNTRNTRHTGRR